MNQGARKLPLKMKIGYGAPGWATMFTITIVTTYGLYFLADIVGMCGLVTYTLNGMYQIFYAYLPDFIDLESFRDLI